jgi:hypothetical protein
MSAYKLYVDSVTLLRYVLVMLEKAVEIAARQHSPLIISARTRLARPLSG